MESGTILHLALLRKISNLSSNPNYRQKLSHPKKTKMLTENDSYLPSFQNYKKQTPLPLIQISNRQLNNKVAQKKKKKALFFQEQNTTISGWSIHGVDENEDYKQIKQARYKQKIKQQNEQRHNQAKNLRRKNHSLAKNFWNQKNLQVDHHNEQLTHKSDKNNFYLKDLSLKKKYSLVKQVNLSYLPEFQTLRRQQKTETCLQLGEKLRSFQAFVSQLKLKHK